MAAIFEPHRLPSIEADRARRSERPALRLVQGGAGRPTPEPVPLRAVVAGVLLFLLLAVGAVAVGRGALAGLAPAPTAGPAATAGAATGAATVEVQPGDSLWSIATDLRPEGDVRALVDELVALNGSAPLVPGQQVVLPS